MEQKKTVPGYTQCIEAAFGVLKASKKSILEDTLRASVLKKLNCPEAEKSLDNELHYRVGCALAFLRTRGVVERNDEDIWRLTPQFLAVNDLNVEEVEDFYRIRKSILFDRSGETNTLPWERRLYEVVHKLPTKQFVSLMEKILKTEGFSDIKMVTISENGDCFGTAIAPADRTKRSAFCCKRSLPIVKLEDIREFRGSFKTNVKRGLFFSFGVFSSYAEEEALDPDKVPIRLVDGMELIHCMVQERIGVTEIKDYQIDVAFFEEL